MKKNIWEKDVENKDFKVNDVIAADVLKNVDLNNEAVSEKVKTLKRMCGEYSNRIDDLKAKWVEQNIKLKIKYIPVTKKIALCNNIVFSTTHSVDVIDGKKVLGEFKINSVNRYLLYVMTLVNEYTNIEIDFSHVIECYDAIMENELLSVLLGIIPKSEMEEFKVLLKMIYEDVCENERSLPSYFDGKINKLIAMLDDLGELESLRDNLANINIGNDISNDEVKNEVGINLVNEESKFSS